MLNIEHFKNIHAGEPGWIVGNGPSLNEMELRFLGEKVNFCMNRIYLGEVQFGFTPKYYTVEDNFVAEDNSEEIDTLRYTKFLPKDLEYCLSDADDVCWINFLRKYDDYPLFSDDASKVTYWGSTVTYLAIQLAFFMGCDPIYLIGVDFDYAVPDYADGPNITSRGSDPNHFHPDYFGLGKRWHHPRLDLVRHFFIEARRFIENRGRRIFNAGIGGKLTVFERVNYLDVI